MNSENQTQVHIILSIEPSHHPCLTILRGSNNTPSKTQTPKPQTLFMTSTEVTQEH